MVMVALLMLVVVFVMVVVIWEFAQGKGMCKTLETKISEAAISQSRIV
jgi:hypothetical protein